MPDIRKNGFLRFDRFKLDAEKLMLYRDEAEIALPPKVVKTLAVLIENRGSILSKDELIEQVWSDSIVEESNLSQNLYLLRKSLGKRPDGGTYIETLRRRGYRFTGNVYTDEIPSVPANIAVRPQPPFKIERRGNVLRFVDRRESAEAFEGRRLHSPPLTSVGSARSRIYMALGGFLIAAFAVAGIVLFRNYSSLSADRRVGEMSVVKITDGPRPVGASLSPDGGYLGYAEMDGAVSRVFVQQVGQSSRLEILSSSDNLHQAVTFSNDGRHVYINSSDRKNERTWLTRVPSIGGSAVHIIDQINGPVSFSPDGTEMAFTRAGRNGDRSVLIADIEGKNVRTLISRNLPSSLGDSPSWSPDGRAIAVAEWAYRPGLGKFSNRLLIVHAAEGRSRELASEDWANIFRLAWSREGDGIAMIATRWQEAYTTRRDQVFFVSYPDGKSQRITTDGNRHEVASLGVAAGGVIAAVSSNRSSQLWSMAANGEDRSAFQISRGSADGRAGLSPLADGRIAYVARSGDELTLWVANSDGSDAKQLAAGMPVIEESRAAPSGKFVVFASSQAGRNHLFRIDSEGSNLRQLTFGDSVEVDADISVDDSRVVYGFANKTPDGYKFRLVSVPSSGGEAVPFGSVECSRPMFSPDGKKLSCISASDEVLILSPDAAEIERIKFPPNAAMNYGVDWLPNNSGLAAVIEESSGNSNIWAFPLNKGKPARLTNFSSGMIYRYAFSVDGSRLYLARGYPTQDAVLITNFK